MQAAHFILRKALDASSSKVYNFPIARQMFQLQVRMIAKKI